MVANKNYSHPTHCDVQNSGQLAHIGWKEKSREKTLTLINLLRFSRPTPAGKAIGLPDQFLALKPGSKGGGVIQVDYDF